MKIIKIGAVWCPGCLIMKKVWKNILVKYPDLELEDLDYDMDFSKVNNYNPGKVLPVIIFLDNDNNELERLIGEQKEEIIIEKIDKYRGNNEKNN